MPVTKTRQDLVNQALRDLGVLAAGQTATTEDYQAVDNHVDGTLDQLDQLTIATVEDQTKIPAAWLDPLAICLAQNSAFEFGLPGVPASPDTPNPIEAAHDLLRAMTRAQATGERQRTEYF